MTMAPIVPRLQGLVTTPRNDTHIVAAEYGWVDLKGNRCGSGRRL